MHPQQFASRPSSRVPSPLHSSSVTHLANDFSRLSQSEDVSGPFQPGGSPAASSVIQMPSVEASLKQPCASPGHMPSPLPRPSASPPPVVSWSQYPGQQRPYAPYGPTGHPPFPPSESRPTPMPHRNSSPTIGPAYDRYHPNMQYGHTSFPQAEQYYPTDGQGSPHAIPSALQGPYMPTDNPGYPYAAPYPPQDYQQQVPPTRPHPGGSNSPRPFPPPKWGMNPPPPRACYFIFTVVLASLMLAVFKSSSYAPTVFGLLRPELQLRRRQRVQSHRARLGHAGKHRGEGCEETDGGACSE